MAPSRGDHLESFSCCKSPPGNGTHLLELAFPTLLILMRPCISESSPPRFRHHITHRILLHLVQILIPLFDVDIDRPATMWNVVQVLDSRIVFWVPAVQRFVAEKTSDAIFAGRRRFVIESGARELQSYVRTWQLHSSVQRTCSGAGV